MSATGRNQRTTGPCPVPDAVLAAMTEQMSSHRDPSFTSLVATLMADLRHVFGSSGTVVPLTASGTGGLEAAARSTVDPGSRALVVSTGHFGERAAEVLRRCGARVTVARFPWGTAADPCAVAEAVSAHRPSVVFLTHNETSTGVLNPLGSLCAAIRDRGDPLLCVDVVSSLGAAPVDCDDNGIDIAVGVTQKALMAPPGLALLALSDRARREAARSATSTLYFDLERAAARASSGETSFTPALPIVRALRVALDLLLEEGLDAVFARHRRLAARCRSWVEEAGLRPFAEEGAESPTVTAMETEPGAAPLLRERLSRDRRTEVGVGREQWRDRMLRVGHMGWVAPAEIDALGDALLAVMGDARAALGPPGEAIG